jgi:hypothetical protein
VSSDTSGVVQYVLSSLRRAAENAYSWSLTPNEAGLLVAEVERLRAEVAESEARRLQLLDDAGGLENECRTLRELLDAKSHEAGLYARRMEQAQRSRDEARAEERADAVAWLRSKCDDPEAWWVSVFDHAADVIERGEHKRTPAGKEKP